jgi:predicted nucleic acid-binding protein
MRVLIDACVLYPTVLREIVLGCAAEGAFTPLWSARILEEWARAAARIGPGEEAVACGEIALLRARWPEADVTVNPATEARLWLPDPDDVHVLAAAVDGRADVLLTLNIRDFPKRELDAEAILLRHPDEFLMELHAGNPGMVRAVVGRVHAEAERLSGDTLPLRALMKRARLPRVGKALAP